MLQNGRNGTQAIIIAVRTGNRNRFRKKFKNQNLYWNPLFSIREMETGIGTFEIKYKYVRFFWVCIGSGK